MTDNPLLTPDLVVFARWVVPVVPTQTVLENYALFVTDGRITHLLPANDAKTMLSEAALAGATQLNNHALLPGLVNAHGHAAMTLLRGVGDDMPLQAWLEERIWPLEGELADASFVNAGVRLAAAEMILSGTTCFADNYFFPRRNRKGHSRDQAPRSTGVPSPGLPHTMGIACRRIH